MSGSQPPLVTARRGERVGAMPGQRWLPLRSLLDAEQDTHGPARLLEGLLPLAPGQPAARVRRHPRSPHVEPLVMYRGLYEIHRRLTEAPLDAPAPPPGGGIPCRQTNRSASGAAVILKHERRRAVVSGDFVLLESAREEPHSRYVARVRRLLRRGGDQLEMGLEKLSGQVTPVRIGGPTSAVHGLLCLPPDTRGHELCGPAERLAVGAFLELETPDATLHVKVTAERERDGRLACVAVSLLS
jgi:hypothetical protein